MRLTKNWLVCLLVLSVAGGCADIAHESPYDPAAPLDKQKKGAIDGLVLLTGESDYGQVAVNASGTGFSVDAQTRTDGSFSIEPLTPGTVTLTYTFRGFRTQTQLVTVDLGGRIDAGTVSLEPKSVSITGSALAQVDTGTQEGGVNVAFTRTGGVRAASAAPAFRAAATGVTSDNVQSTYSVISDGDGNYTLTLPAGVYAVIGIKGENSSASTTIQVSGESSVVVEPIVVLPVTGKLKIAGTYAAAVSAFAAPSYAYTSTRLVTLELDGFNAAQMRLGEDFGSGCVYGEPIVFAATRAFELSAGDGEKTVCVRYVGIDGISTDDITASIWFDGTPPSDPFVATQGGEVYLSSSSFPLVLSANEAETGLQWLEFSEGGTFENAFKVSNRSVYRYELTDLSEGEKAIHVRFWDYAGNFTEAVLAVTRDTTAPVGSILVAAGREHVASQFVTVATAASPDVDRITLSNDPGFAISSTYPLSSGLVWALSPVEGMQTVYAKFTDRAGNVSAVYADTVTYDATAPVVTAFSLDVTVSTTSLGLSWQASLAPDVFGYRWFRVRDGVSIEGGFTTVTAVTVPNPLADESYSVAVEYVGGFLSAQSAPASPEERGARSKFLLVVDDDGGTSQTELNLLPLLGAAGFPSPDSITVPMGSDGPDSATLSEYAVVVWNLGESTAAPIAPTLSAADRAAIAGYLGTGGNLLMIAPNVLGDDDAADFLRQWGHTGNTRADLAPVKSIFGVDGDVISDGIFFEVGPAMQGVDMVEASGLSASWLRSGSSIATRYPAAGQAPYRLAWAAIPTTGLRERNVADINTARLDLAFSGDLVSELMTPDANDKAVKKPLGFPIRYGTLVTDHVWISSNGLVSFSGPVTTPIPFDPLPGPGTAVAVVAWADWHPENGGAIYYTASTNYVEVSWQNVPNALGDATLTAGIRIRRDSTIELIMYEAGMGPGPFHIMGFQDGTGRSYAEMGFSVELGYAGVCVLSPCDLVTFPLAYRVYKDLVPETPQLFSNAVRWLAAPSQVVRSQTRYYTINSSVDGASEMRVALDGVLDAEGWIDYDSAYGVDFATEGDQIVKVVYRDEAGNVSEVQTDSGAVDLVAPLLTNVVLADANNGSNASTRTRTVTLQLSGTAGTQDFMRASESPIYADTGWTAFAANSTFTLSEGDGMKFVYVWVKDANGNFSGPVAGSILADTEAPQTRAVVDRIANSTPVYVNASYSEMESPAPWSSLPGLSDCAGGTFVECGKFNISDAIPVSALNVPFSFNYYGRTESKLVVYKNGFASFSLRSSGEDPTHDDADRQAVFLEGAVLAPLMQPLTFVRPAHGVYYFVEATRVTVKWVGVDSRSLMPIETALQLDESGKITFLYGDGNFDVDPVVGISKGDKKNRHLSRYHLARFLPNAKAVAFTPSKGDVASIQLYYRYHYPTGPGPWTYVGNPVNDLFAAISFYPPEGRGDYDFYTEGTDSAGNIETTPWNPDTKVFFDDEPPSAPRRIEGFADGDSVYVKWEPSPSADVIAYNVYYGENANLNGDDAIEGASPFQVPVETQARLTGLEAGKRVYISVTAIDSVGNESPLPGGTSVIPLRNVRRLATIDGNATVNAVLKGDDLFVLETTGFMNTFVWYDLSNPGMPEKLASTAPGWDPSFLVWDGFAYARSASYSVDVQGVWAQETGTLGGNFSVPFPGPSLLTLGSEPAVLVRKNIRNGSEEMVGASSIGGRAHRLVTSPRASFAVTVATECPDCASYVHAVTSSNTGTAHLAGTLVLPYEINAVSIQDQYAAFGADYVDGAGQGFVEVFDVSNPAAPQLVVSAEANPMAIGWVGDQLAFADYFGLRLWEAGDIESPVGTGGLALNGFGTSLAFNGTIGVATLNTGLDVFELGELLPSNLEHVNVPLAGQISAMVTKGNFAYVAEETGISIFDVSSMASGGPVLLSRFTPFVGTALEVVSHYLVALDDQRRLNVFDVADPAQPLRIWVETSPPEPLYGNADSLVVFGTAVYLNDRAYNIANPESPALIATYSGKKIVMLRAGGGLVYGAVDAGTVLGHPAVTMRVFDVSQGQELVTIGEYPFPITNLADFVVDGRSLYVYQQEPVGELTVLDVSDPVTPGLRGTHPVGSLVSSSGNRYLTASRGFLYLAASESGISEMLQIDMRSPNPAIAFGFRAAPIEYIAAPFVVTSQDYLLAAGIRSLSAIKVSPNVPLIESVESGPLAGAAHVALGGRHGFYAIGDKIAKVSRRSPLLTLEAEGAGEVALRKVGDKLFVYDPPGIPATELVNDGVFDLSHPDYDTRKELCDMLDATPRLRCSYDALDPKINAPSASLLDAFGVRLRNDPLGNVESRASLRTPEVDALITLPGVVTALHYQNGLLFAGVQGAGAGLYVIDPVSMNWSFHNVGDVRSMAVRDAVVYLGGTAQIMAYRWTERVVLTYLGPLPGNVTDVRLGRGALVYLVGDFDFAVSTIGKTGALTTYTPTGPFPMPLKAVVPYAEDRFVTISTSGGLLFWSGGASPALEQAFNDLGPVNFVKYKNGRLLLGIDEELHIVEVSGKTPKNLMRRVLFVPGGTVFGADVLGDVLAVAAGPAGGVAYQLK